MNTISVFLLDNKATPPTRNHSTDAGLDLYALEDVYIPLGRTVMVKTGVAVQVPVGYVGLLRERSSIGRAGLKVAGGVIDTGYSSDVSILLMNVSNSSSISPIFDNPRGFKVSKGDRVAQLILTPIITPKVVIVDKLWTSERGDKSFGSSGA